VGTAHSNYNYVTGEFHVPTVTQCPNAAEPDSHLTWVGIGGDGSSTNLIQNGVGSGATSDYGDTLQPYAWWETPNHNIASTNHLVDFAQRVMPVRAGDDMVVSTQYIPSQHRVKFYWHNKTRGIAKTITVTGRLDNTTATATEPGHIANYYTGATAEAIDERASGLDANNHPAYHRNRQHTVTHWINVRVSNTGPSSAVAIRSQAHDRLIMTNVAYTVPLDTPTGITGYPARFDSTWNHCGPYELIP
jgi:hypothetical protein